MTHDAGAESPDTEISLVIPYAGPAPLLRETVRSVLDQEDPCWRLVVVEDGDQDAAVEPWVRGIADSRVRYVKNPITLGVAANFQRCLDLAETPYVSFPGSDDRLDTRYVSTIRQALVRHRDVAVVQPGVRVIDAAGCSASPLADRLKSALRPPTGGGTAVVSGERLMASLMRGNWTYFPSLCWRRDQLATLGFRQDLATVLDLEVLGRLCLGGARMLVLDEVVFDYRRHAASASSMTAVRTDRFDEERSVARELSRAAAARGWRRASRTASWRLSSRLHAASLLPSAVAGRDWEAARTLAGHVWGR